MNPLFFRCHLQKFFRNTPWTFFSRFYLIRGYMEVWLYLNAYLNSLAPLSSSEVNASGAAREFVIFTNGLLQRIKKPAWNEWEKLDRKWKCDPLSGFMFLVIGGLSLSTYTQIYGDCISYFVAPLRLRLTFSRWRCMIERSAVLCKSSSLRRCDSYFMGQINRGNRKDRDQSKKSPELLRSLREHFFWNYYQSM